MNSGGVNGALIDGRFELLERLGGGAMGLVWRARDVVLHREVALKEVRPPDPMAAEFDPEGARVLRERVLREAQALARLHHPNVVTIYHIVESAQLPHPWLVMELVTGGSLEDRLNRGPMMPHEAAAVGRGVLAALRAAHQAGIQHRDVKPANVLLRPDGTPVLTDFGIAALRESTALTSTGSVIGSPEFIAPERLRGEEGNPASDLWSLGIMIFAAAEGYSPLRRTTTMATLAAVLDEPIPAPVRSGPLLPALSAVLVRDPAGRCGPELLDRLLAEAQFGSGMNTGMNPMPGSPLGSAQGASLGATGYRHPLGAGMSAGTTSPRPGAVYQDAQTGLSPLETAQPSPATRRGRKSVFAVSVAGTAAVGLLGALLWSMGQSPKSTTQAGSGPSTSLSASSSTGVVNATPASQAPPTSALPDASSVNFLTPGGAQELIKNVKSVMGTTVITDWFYIYPTHANGPVVTSANTSLDDDYAFANGSGSDTGPDGTLDSSSTTVDLTSFDWNALPGLMADLQKDFKVTSAPQFYIVVIPDWMDGPTMVVYMTDDHNGGGYLDVNQKGVITGTYSM